MEWYSESAGTDWGGVFSISRVLYRNQTDYQDLVIFENPTFGRALGLDGVLQTTERDEFLYHEMIAHVPILAHGEARRVLIIRGGDGGALEEVLKHRAVERAVLVEVDGQVIDLCRQYLPDISKGAFDDPRSQVIIGEGRAYVADTEEEFDVILVDSNDPIGPSQVLFTDAFYRDCARRLRPGGILVAQTGQGLLNEDRLRPILERMRLHLAEVAVFRASVPSYAGGDLCLAWAADAPGRAEVSLERLIERYERAGLDTRCYSPRLHLAAFVLPRWLEDLGGSR